MLSENSDIKHVVIVSSCIFTQIGLSELCKKLPIVRYINAVTSVLELQQHLENMPQIDVLLMKLQGTEYNAQDALHLITEIMPKVHQNCRVILLMDKLQHHVLCDYFSELPNVYAVWEADYPLWQLIKGLNETLLGEPKKSNLESTGRLNMLSPRESEVLHGLLEGRSLVWIAKNLDIRFKTVSHYKRTALVKLGVRNLQLLLLDTCNRVLVLSLLNRRKENQEIQIISKCNPDPEYVKGYYVF